MHEIITLQIGGTGNSIGDTFWHVVSHEHGVDYTTGKFSGTSPLQLERINVLFNATSCKTFYARAICVDTETNLLEQLRSRSSLYRPENFVYGSESAGNNYARGYHTEGASLLESVLNNIRREAEAVDSLQGFQILHSIGGGTGSGLTALIMNNLVEEYPDNLISNYVSIPSPNISQVVVEPYNSLLSMPSLINNSHLTFCFDNEALFHICSRNLQMKYSGYDHVNHIVSLAMSGITTCLRFPGQLNAGLRKIYVNMVPFPRLHFLIPGLAPMLTHQPDLFCAGTVAELVQQIFDSNNLLCAVDLRNGKLLTASAIFRGCVSPREIDQLMSCVRRKNSEFFVDWIPNSIKTAICNIPPRGLQMSATFIGNTTTINSLLQRIYDASAVMLKKKVYLHWYTGECMEEQEFTDALGELKDLINDYKESSVDKTDEENDENVKPKSDYLLNDHTESSVGKTDEENDENVKSRSDFRCRCNVKPKSDYLLNDHTESSVGKTDEENGENVKSRSDFRCRCNVKPKSDYLLNDHTESSVGKTDEENDENVKSITDFRCCSDLEI